MDGDLLDNNALTDGSGKKTSKKRCIRKELTGWVGREVPDGYRYSDLLNAKGIKEANMTQYLEKE